MYVYIYIYAYAYIHTYIYMCVCVCLCVLCIAYVCRCCLRLYVVYLFSANWCIHRVKNHVIRTCQVNNYLSAFSYSVCLEDSEKSAN